MNPILKNILAVLTGLVVGSIVNMSLIMMSGSVIAAPPGADLTTTDGLKASMALMQPQHFIFPFLAHALGTLVGAYLAARIAATRKMAMAITIGCFFLAGGITNIVLLPSPLWFNVLDLSLAYLPMAYFGARLASRSARKKA